MVPLIQVLTHNAKMKDGYASDVDDVHDGSTWPSYFTC
jgi:hypothetical protein